MIATSKESETLESPTLDELRELYGRGLYMQAHRLGLSSFGPFQHWPGTNGQILAARLMANLGSRRRADAQVTRAWRNDPTDPDACYFYVYARFTWRGPLSALQAHQACGSLPSATPGVQADWCAQRAHIYASLRDFDSAAQWLDRAAKIDNLRPWIWVERSHVLELEDKQTEALAAAQHALELRPWYRPAVQAAAHLLLQSNREPQSLELLQHATRHLESGDIWMQLAQLQSELGLHAEARQSWETAAELLPLLDKQYQEYLVAQRCEAAYECGDVERCVELAGQLDRPFFKSLLENIKAAPADAKRVKLPVGFVRQHHMTCAPATLSALSGYWNMPADHLNVAEEICYDGTPGHSERRWAQKNGYLVREFKVTWDAAVALLDRGVPFTLTTVEPTSAHLQAVIGYDARRRTLLIRDPSFRQSVQTLAEPLFERYASTGPRGMAMVPQDQAHLLADLNLPEAELYDYLHRIEVALQAHRRTEAASHYEALQVAAPGHRLQLLARRALAYYDTNAIDALAASEEQLKLFPKDPALQLQKLALLKQQAKREDRIQLLETIIADPPVDPVFWLQYVDEHIDDARQHPKLLKLLRKAVRFRPQLAGAYHDLARIFWIAQRREVSLELQKIAACLEDKDERFSETYFIVSRNLGRAEEALKMLRGRFDRYGARSCRPGRTLSWALAELNRTLEAQQQLADALQKRPSDGELLLYIADIAGRYGKFDEAANRLDQAKDCSHPGHRQRIAADLALYRGDKAAALRTWRAIIDSEPLATDAHRTYSQLLAEIEGVDAAIEHARQAVAQFPHHYGLHQLLVEWLRGEHDRQAWYAATLRMAEVFPTDVWARRELASCLLRLHQVDEAIRAAEAARDLDPSDSWSWSTLGYILWQAGKQLEARSATEQAIRLSIDNGSAIAGLLAQNYSPADRREAIIFVYEELCRQTTLGDGLDAWREQAESLLDSYTLMHVLFEALQSRPDLWQTWSAVVQQLGSMGKLDHAQAMARRATERFPLLPQIWLDLAEVERRRINSAAEREALEQALRINNRWGVALRLLSSNYEREQNFVRAAEILEQAIHHAPLDAINHGCLASVLWKLGRRDEAFDRLRIALRHDPGYEWAWSSMSSWGKEVGQPHRAYEVAKELTEQRPGEARSWHMLAQVARSAEKEETALAAVSRAIELAPRWVVVRDFQSQLLAEVGRFDEATAAACPAIYDGEMPLELRGRAAWVEAKRGNLLLAIEKMEQILADSPDYWFGMEQLADWYDQMQNWQQHAQVCQRMVEVAPHYSVAYGYRGYSRIRAEDREGAKADLRLALKHDPTYVYAALLLYDLLLEDNELVEAQVILGIVKAHAPSEYVTSREVQLATRQYTIMSESVNGGRPARGFSQVTTAEPDRKATAFALFAELCQNPNTAQSAIHAAAEAIRQDFGRDAMETELRKWATSAGANPEVSSVLVESLAERSQWRSCNKLLKSIAGNDEAWRRAALSYLRVAKDKKQTSLVRKFIKRNRDALQRETWTWGYVAEVLFNVDQKPMLVKWCANWKTRHDARPRMLFYFALGLRYRFQDNLAQEVNRFAITLPPDETFQIHRLWLLLEELLDHGIPADCNRRVAEIDAQNLGDFYEGMLAATKQLAEILKSGNAIKYRAAKKQVLIAAKGEFSAAMATVHPFRRIKHRICAKLATDRGRPWLATWHRLAARAVKFIPRFN